MVGLHRTNQGGSVVNFVVIGVILVLAVTSVAYVVQKRGEQARKNIAVAAVDELTKNSQTSVKDNDTAKTEATKANNGAVTAPSDTTKTESTPTPSSHLPATGPEQSVSNLMAVGIITFSLVSFIKSRKNYDSLSLT